MNARGFTISEVMISLAISTTVILVVLESTTFHLDLAQSFNSRIVLSTDLIAINDYFSREILNSGGEYLPVWAAIAVENACGPRATFPDCKGSDRLTLMQPVGYQGCQVSGSSAGLLKFDKTTCCLKTVDVQDSHVMLTQGGELAQKYVTSVDLGNCQATVINGPLSFRDTKPASYDWTGASVMPVLIQTYYLNQRTNELGRVTYLNQAADQNAVTDTAIIDRVLDFQAALGFDFAPEDGVSTDLGNDKDEWLYNNPGGGEALGVGFLAGVSLSILKMVNVTLTLGLPNDGAAYRHSIRALDGPMITRPNMMMDVGSTKMLLRSLRTFQ